MLLGGCCQRRQPCMHACPAAWCCAGQDTAARRGAGHEGGLLEELVDNDAAGALPDGAAGCVTKSHLCTRVCSWLRQRRHCGLAPFPAVAPAAGAVPGHGHLLPRHCSHLRLPGHGAGQHMCARMPDAPTPLMLQWVWASRAPCCCSRGHPPSMRRLRQPDGGADGEPAGD